MFATSNSFSDFWQDSGLHPIDIPVFFPVYSTSPLIMVNQMDLCSNIPHLYTIYLKQIN